MRLSTASTLPLTLLLFHHPKSATSSTLQPPPSQQRHFTTLNFSSPAPHILSSTASLLQQWPNTFHPTGHTLAACTIPPHTLLYHGRHDSDMPEEGSPEWLAFDVEMAYAIMGSLPDSRLLTYRTTRQVRCLYFDGASADLMTNGGAGLEAQMVFLYGDSGSVPGRPGPPAPPGGHRPPPPPPDREKGGPGEGDGGKGREGGGRGPHRPPPGGHWNPLEDEYFRAEGLCRWIREKELGGRGWGFEGVVRMNAGFEVIWCDFGSPSLRLAANLNVSAPRIGMAEQEDKYGARQHRRQQHQRPLDLGPQTALGALDKQDQDGPASPSPFNEGPHGPGMTDPREPFRGAANWMWFTAASRRYGARGEARAHIDASSCGGGAIFSFFDPRLRDQESTRIEQERAALNISDDGTWRGPGTVEGGEVARAVALEQLLRRRRGYRIDGVSRRDGQFILEAVERRMRAVVRGGGEGAGEECSGIDWRLTAQEIVAFYAANIRNLLLTLEEVPGAAERRWVVVREWLEAVRVLTHWFMMPFLEYPRGPYTNETLKVDFAFDSPAMQEAVERCQYQYGTESMQRLAEGEQLLSWAVDETLGGICNVLFRVGLEVEYEWLSRYNVDPEQYQDDFGEQPALSAGREWKMIVEELMAWLGWVEQWTGCEGPCRKNEICYIPMWPALSNGIGPRPGSMEDMRPPGHPGWDMEKNLWQPYCINASTWMHPQGRL